MIKGMRIYGNKYETSRENILERRDRETETEREREREREKREERSREEGITRAK